MKRVHLVSINLKWDSNGRLSHKLATRLQLNDYQRDDAVAASVPMLISSQLGTLVPHHALVLCTRSLALLERSEHIIEPINSALKKVRIDLWKAAGVFHTFHPKSRFLANNNSVEEGVRQFLNNYVGYVPRVVSGNFPKRVRDTLLTSIRVYLDIVLSEAQATSIDSAKGNWNIQKAMLEFSAVLYDDLWSSHELPEEKFAPLLVETKSLYLEVRRRLGIES